jgi:hypothetical protein
MPRPSLCGIEVISSLPSILTTHNTTTTASQVVTLQLERVLDVTIKVEKCASKKKNVAQLAVQ